MLTSIRGIFWPMHNDDYKRVLPLAIMLFCIIFNYSILRDMKDTLILHKMDTEALITIMKSQMQTFSLIFVFLIYSFSVFFFKRQTVFYIITLPFLCYFALFAFYLYPNTNEAFKQTEVIQYVRLFYVLSDIWAKAMPVLGFWVVANQVVTFAESKRFYVFFGLVASFALLISDPIVVFISESCQDLNLSIKALITLVLIASGISMIAHIWLNKNIKNEQDTNDKNIPTLKSIFSMDLFWIAVVVIASSFAIDWGNHLLKIYLKTYAAGNKELYLSTMGYMSSIKGKIGIIAFVFIPFILKSKSGWLKTATIMPIISFFIGSIIFINSITYKLFMFECAAALSIALSVAKVFLITLAMFYTLLSMGEKTIGCAGVNMLIAPFSKILFSAILILGIQPSKNFDFSVESYAIFCGAISLWILGVYRLHKRNSAD
ncbi:MAG: ADP,ATP carrier protein 1 [Holosporales bacterium]